MATAALIKDEHAQILYDFIDVSTEGTWPRVRDLLVDTHGYNPQDIVDAVNALAKVTSRCPLLDIGDFE